MGNTAGGSMVLPGVPHTVVDNMLVIAWLALFLLAAVILLNLPTADLISAGYRKEIFSDAGSCGSCGSCVLLSSLLWSVACAM